MRRVYLDNGSTSYPKAPGVGKTMMEFIEDVGCNVGRGGYKLSYSLAERIINAREKLCRLFNFDKVSNVIFTPNVTYSLNFLIAGLLKPGDHVITSSMEHNAVARPIEEAKNRGIEVDIAYCNNKGELDLSHFESLIQSNTKAVVMLHGSNVSGTLMPVEKVASICEKYDIYFILDAAQTAGVFDLDMKKIKIDALAFTGHKGLLGPQGIGGFLIEDKLAESITPIIQGGTGSISDSLDMPDFLPDKFESGTLNIPGILGLSTALDYILDKGIDNIRKRELRLTELFLEGIKNRDDITVIGLDTVDNRCAIVSLDFINRDNAELAFRLDDEYGIMTRCGLHCAPMAHKTLGTFPKGTVRFAFGHFNTEEEIYYTIDAIEKILAL
ncbi:MAG: aminotransferase class V-fold PLP-dependent enzyme [Clostridiales bacterium]|nr:aminotransferase class V-fold PLP-dependent enzyme [Clostridiales bacterium]